MLDISLRKNLWRKQIQCVPSRTFFSQATDVSSLHRCKLLGPRKSAQKHGQSTETCESGFTSASKIIMAKMPSRWPTLMSSVRSIMGTRCVLKNPNTLSWLTAHWAENWHRCFTMYRIWHLSRPGHETPPSWIHEKDEIVHGFGRCALGECSGYNDDIAKNLSNPHHLPQMNMLRAR